MKKILVLIICFIISMQILVYSYDITAESAVVMNAATHEVVFQKNEHEQRSIASTTKIVTLITALENSSPNETVTVSEKAVSEEGSSAYLEAGAKIRMIDLEYGLMLNSGNDAAVAIAEHISGDTKLFAEKMTELATKIGAMNTKFSNPNGLESKQHYSTAYDIALITAYAVKNEEFKKIVSTKTYDAQYIGKMGETVDCEYINHNKLLKTLDGCVGVKTGFTKAAGRCLVSYIVRNGIGYIIVTLNDPDDWKDHVYLAENAFKTSRIIHAVSRGECVALIKAGSKKIPLTAASDGDIAVNGEKGRDINIIPNIPNLNDISINKGEKVGELRIVCDGVTALIIDVISTENIYGATGLETHKNFFMILINLLKNTI